MSALKNNVADLIWKKPGKDVQIVSMKAHFALNELYQIQVEVKSTCAELKPEGMLNEEAELVLKCGAELEDERIFGGIITRFIQGRTRHGNLQQATTPIYGYQLEIRPKLWLLTRQFRSKVYYPDKTVRDIVEQVLDDHSVKGKWEIAGDLPTREYVVQYNETDYQFIRRLLEDEGICFYFDQEQGKVIFSNKPSGHCDCRPIPDARYVEEVSPRYQFGKQEFIRDFSYEEEIASGAMALHHYNYETSQIRLLSENESSECPSASNLETYEHSQNFVDMSEGDCYADLRQEMHFGQGKLGRGSGSCRSLEAGYVVNISDHFRSELNGRWLLVTTLITAEQGHFQCRFGALLAKIPYRPIRATPRPKVLGLQTAVVTGPRMGEPYLDRMGRCKVQFHWDREGEKDEGSSMWVRVSNNYAGKDYGIQWIPRVGHEVLVTFIDGDPSQPIVTGRVYNDFNTNPLGPAEKYQNIIKTIKDNHLLFDDKDGAERVDVRAHRDMNTLVERNDTQTVGSDRQIGVGHDHTESIRNDMTISVGRDLSETVGKNYDESVGKNLTISVGNDMRTQVDDDKSLTVGDNLTENVASNISVSAGKCYRLDVAEKASVSVGDNISVSGDRKGTLYIEDQLVVKVGSAKLILNKNGDILIKGKNLNVKCSGNIVMKGCKIGLN